MFEMIIAKLTKIQKNSTIQVLNNQEFLFHNAILGGSYAASFKYDRRCSMCSCGFDGIPSQSQSRKTKTNKMFNDDSSGFFYLFFLLLWFAQNSFTFYSAQSETGRKERGGKSVFYWKDKHKHIPSQLSNYKP